MPISIAGSGTITGISAGGLPDDCITTAEIAANAVTTAEIAVNAVTTAKLGTNEASGLCKAWVNFNGTGVVAIRASYNVSSITDNDTGTYTVNFTTAMVDTNYCLNGTGNRSSTGSTLVCQDFSPITARTTSSIMVRFEDVNTTNVVDTEYAQVAIFR